MRGIPFRNRRPDSRNQRATAAAAGGYTYGDNTYRDKRVRPFGSAAHLKKRRPFIPPYNTEELAHRSLGGSDGRLRQISTSP